MSEINEFNTPASDSIETLFATIEEGLDGWNLIADGQTKDNNYLRHAQAALAALRKRVADLEAERDDFHRLATVANDWFGTTAINDHGRIMRWQKEFDSLNKRWFEYRRIEKLQQDIGHYDDSDRFDLVE